MLLEFHWQHCDQHWARTLASDAQACLLPAAQPGWREIALSCCQHQDKAVLVLDLARMFSRFTTSPA